jgi:2-oxoglutarate dehydrogenase E2 component (dihydrolipoamide succinyltransferase)
MSRRNGHANGNGSDGSANGSTTDLRTRRRRFARFFLSPRARRLAAEHGVDASAANGTGSDGRVTSDDVLALVESPAVESPAVEARRIAWAPTVAPPPAAPSAAPPAAVPPPGPSSTPSRRRTDEIVPLSRIRKLTGEHMVRSKATAPHALSVVEVDFDGVDAVRKAAGLTYLPFVARAVVDAIGRYPNLNATVGDDALTVRRDVHLGIAVDLDHEGLVVPVVRNADGKRLPRDRH